MPSKRKDTTTKQSMKNSYKRNLKSAFYEKFLQEEQKRIEQVDAHILKLVESTMKVIRGMIMMIRRHEIMMNFVI